MASPASHLRPLAPPAPTLSPTAYDFYGPGPDGSCEVQLDELRGSGALKELEQSTGVRLRVDARWEMQNGFFLTTATATARVHGHI